MNIKEIIYRYFAGKAPERNPIFPSYNDIQNVLVLYESDYLERNDLVKQLLTDLQRDGKTVSAWGFLRKKDIQSLILPVGRILGTRDFDILGRPKTAVRDDLARENFDLMIDLTQNDILEMRYIALYAQANFKAGRLQSNKALDFMIDMPIEETPEPLFRQILHYLKTINH